MVRDKERVYPEEDLTESWRTPYRRDYARLIHSSAFRRLQGKTQLFPGQESDFFRNRLTHSLEVAQIAKAIALKLNYTENLSLDLDLIEFSSLAHDLGHPPFGHNGEAQLDICMMEHGGFEGNAQTLRILTKLEKKIIDARPVEGNIEARVGLNLTYRSLASILKYDKKIPVVRKSEKSLVKGYYASEAPVVSKIKEALVGKSFKQKFKTIECSIMDTADDIAYSIYDFEDMLKAGFCTPLSLIQISENEEFIKKIAQKVIQTDALKNEDVIKVRQHLESIASLANVDTDTGVDLRRSITLSNIFSNDGYFRVSLTSSLVKLFLEGVHYIPNEQYPILSTVALNNEMDFMVKCLKHFNYEYMINSQRLHIVAYRGKEIVKKLFEVIYNNLELLPSDFFDLFKLDESQRARIVSDFIAGMTDRYAVEFYGRLTSEDPQTIFKPL